MQLNTRVTSARFDDANDEWAIETEDGRRARCRYLITAVGPLSTPIMPKIEGIDSFEGESHHTGLWPREPVSFKGKRVAVIGTGASAVQLIPVVAQVAAHLTVSNAARTGVPLSTTVPSTPRK